MRLLHLSSAIAIAFSTSALHAQTVCVKSRTYEGAIFPKEYSIERFYQFPSPRYTPSEADIAVAESLLQEQIPSLQPQLAPSQTTCPVLTKKLSKYQRQYFGFQDAAGSKIVFINFVWREKKYANTICKDIIFVFDGCSYFWQAKVNLDTRSIYDIHVNSNG